VRQVLRAKLFTAAGGGPGKISEYGGKGPLGAWVRVVAVRAALNLKPRSREVLGFAQDFAGEALVARSDPELRYMKGRYRAELQNAFEEALTALPARNRTVLRLHYVDGLTLDRIAPLYRVTRSTVHRWITEAREQVFEDTRQRLRQALRVSPVELESLVEL